MHACPIEPAETGGTWRPGPLEPRLGRGSLHVWRADVYALPGALASLLAADELARAQRIRGVRRRAHWSLSRGLLRALLGAYVGEDARELRLTRGPYGKPALAGDGEGRATAPPPPLWFNVSHSAAAAVYAFSADGPVGVDVEDHRREIDAVALAARAFGPAQASRLATLHPADRQREFRRAWVRHEAALKCRGVGLGGPGDHGAGAGPDAAPPAWIAGLEMGPHAVGAVAATRPPSRLSCWEWPPAGAREIARV